MKQNAILKTLTKPLLFATFFMAFPVFTIVQNISFFFLVYFFYKINAVTPQLLKAKSLMGVVAIFMIIASFLSTIKAGLYFGIENFVNAIKVLPNYSYWGILIIFLGNVFFRFVTYDQLGKMVFWGVCANITGRYIFYPILNLIPLYNAGSQNSFAFQLIIFAPIASSYIHKKYNSYFYTFTFIGLISLAGALSGSRSASILVLVGATASILLGNFIQISITAFLTILASFVIPSLIKSPQIMTAIQQINPRTYELLYESENILQTDRSYLTRLAMIEKGLNIFEDHPISGIGIGNFMITEYEIDFKFEGSEYIESKEDELMHTNAHNSYISFLSEGGILLTIPMLLIMFTPIVFFVINFFYIPNEHKGLFVGIIFMCIHAWFIAGMVNVMGWFLLGIANAYILNFRQFKIKKI
jgi:O-antigen ligase